MLGDVCAIVMGGHHPPSLAVLIVIILVLIDQSLFVATQINETAAAYQVSTICQKVTFLSRVIFRIVLPTKEHSRMYPFD
jgi:hypothetical protein